MDLIHIIQKTPQTDKFRSLDINDPDVLRKYKLNPVPNYSVPWTIDGKVDQYLEYKALFWKVTDTKPRLFRIDDLHIALTILHVQRDLIFEKLRTLAESIPRERLDAIRDDPRSKRPVIEQDDGLTREEMIEALSIHLHPSFQSLL